jgi:hypothetical protein
MTQMEISTGKKISTVGEDGIGETTEISWSPPDDMTYETWSTIGCTLQTVHRSMRWWIGDWLNAGETKYGETYTQALIVTDSSLETIKKYKAIAERVRKEDRIADLSYTHHFCVAYLPQQEHHDLLQLAHLLALTSRTFQQVCKLPEDERGFLMDIFMNFDDEKGYPQTLAAINTMMEHGTIYLPDEEEEDMTQNDSSVISNDEHEIVVDGKEMKYQTDAGADVLDFWSGKGVPVLFANEKAMEWKGIRVMAVEGENGEPLLLWDMIGVE